MKTRIHRVSFKQNMPVDFEKSVWWSWETTCNKCLNIIHKFGERIDFQRPNEFSYDLCLGCENKTGD